MLLVLDKCSSTRSFVGQTGRIRWLSLAYHVHRPRYHVLHTEYAPVVVLHGLFGSKQNYRSVSK